MPGKRWNDAAFWSVRVTVARFAGQLASAGYAVVIGCRSVARGEAAAAALTEERRFGTVATA